MWCYLVGVCWKDAKAYHNHATLFQIVTNSVMKNHFHKHNNQHTWPISKQFNFHLTNKYIFFKYFSFPHPVNKNKIKHPCTIFTAHFPPFNFFPFFFLVVIITSHTILYTIGYNVSLTKISFHNLAPTIYKPPQKIYISSYSPSTIIKSTLL